MAFEFVQCPHCGQHKGVRRCDACSTMMLRGDDPAATAVVVLRQLGAGYDSYGPQEERFDACSDSCRVKLLVAADKAGLKVRGTFSLVFSIQDHGIYDHKTPHLPGEKADG